MRILAGENSSQDVEPHVTNFCSSVSTCNQSLREHIFQEFIGHQGLQSELAKHRQYRNHCCPARK